MWTAQNCRVQRVRTDRQIVYVASLTAQQARVFDPAGHLRKWPVVRRDARFYGDTPSHR